MAQPEPEVAGAESQPPGAQRKRAKRATKRKAQTETPAPEANSNQAERSLTKQANGSIETNEDGQAAPHGKKKRARSAVFRYGNYTGYYGYRLQAAVDADPRLQELDASWFRGRDVLDIGCNSGVLTTSIAATFHCKSMLGVDIDRGLIGEAVKALALERSRSMTQIKNPAEAGAPGRMRDIRKRLESLSATTFQCMDIMDDAAHVEPVGVVMCLSVTKWVHFNWGDDGVRTLFRRVHAALRPGGLFVLEPQPWKSYQKLVKKSAIVAELPIKSLTQFEFFPGSFVGFLQDSLGFQLLCRRQIDEAAKGFERPLLLLRKPDAS